MVVALGIDLVEVDRVVRLWSRHGERAARRLLTEDEWDYCAQRAEPLVHAAVRLAAKEAAFKALSGTVAARRIGWRELEVTPADIGPPGIRFHGRAAARAQELGVKQALLTLTHTASTAGAVVLLLG